MCVAVSLMPGATLTEEEIYRMGTTNGDGIGVAWVKEGAVHWYKTLRYKVGHISHVLDQHLNTPRLVHFRLSTVGGTRPDLCHPFAINHTASCEAVGHAELVMIHNGHWGRYKELLDLCDKEGMLPDKGPWSDTRLIALMAADDLDWLKIITGKVATLDKDGQLTHIGDWDDLREGVKVSNKHWNHDIPVKKGGYSGFNKWPGWDKEWGDKTWEQWEAEKGAREEKRKADIQAAREAVQAERAAMRDEGHNHKGTSHGKEKSGQAEAEKAGPSSSAGGSVGAAPGVAGGDSAGPGHGGGGPRKPLPRGTSPYLATGDIGAGRSYDQTPTRSKTTGRVYQVTPKGDVVEVTDTGADKDLHGPQGVSNSVQTIGEYLDGQEGDTERYRQYWLAAEIRGDGRSGGSSGGVVEDYPVHGEDGDLGDTDGGES